MSSRDELYSRIRESSRDEVILEEMIRLGFWPEDDGVPHGPADEIRRQAELARQLRSLTIENSRLHNVEVLKREARKRRMEASRHKRQETKERRLRERAERAEEWRRRKLSEILYLGDGVSGGLGVIDSDHAKLASHALPDFQNVEQLGQAMGISVGELRFLAFHRTTSTTTHYRRFAIPKKSGGQRIISAPMPRLKRAQEWVLQNILELVPLHPAAHGFIRGRSIVTNASPHVGSEVVINADMEEFFPTISYRRIRGMFRSLGYSEQIATILALICSEPDQTTVSLDGQTYYVARSERRLPQGAPSSPAVTNIICRGLDARLSRVADELGFTYTRYADDLTFSGCGEAVQEIGKVLRRLKYVVLQEGFRLHPKKLRVQRRSRRQEVTGLVVNEKVAVPRDLLRRFRATLYQVDKDGPNGKRWGVAANILNSIEGFANFVAMVDKEKGTVFQQQVQAIFAKHGHPPKSKRPAKSERTPPHKPPAKSPTSNEVDAAPRIPKTKPWWKLW